MSQNYSEHKYQQRCIQAQDELSVISYIKRKYLYMIDISIKREGL